MHSEAKVISFSFLGRDWTFEVKFDQPFAKPMVVEAHDEIEGIVKMLCEENSI